MVAARKIAVLAAKDLRHIWPYLPAVLPLLFLCATNNPDLLAASSGDHAAALWQLLVLATPLAVWSFVAALIHGEPLVGDRQYWLTRPFTWYHLAAAKVLIVAACINVPLFLFQAIELAANGISPLAYLPDLLWRQVSFSAFLLLPAAALAALTRTQGQFALSILLAASPFVGLGWLGLDSGHAPDAEWLKVAAIGALLIAGSNVIFLLQYARRRASVSRVLFAIMAVICFGFQFVRWQNVLAPLTKANTIRLSLNRSARYPSGDWRFRRNEAIELPLAAHDLPPGSELTLNYHQITIDSPELPNFQPSADAVYLHGWNGESGFLQIVLSPIDSRRLQGHAISMKGWITLTLLIREQVLSTTPDAIRISDFGICTRSRKLCLSPHPRASLSFIATPTEQRPDHYGRIVSPADLLAPFPVSPWFYPLDTYHYQPDYGSLLVERPATRFRYDFQFDNIRLEDFAHPY